MNLFWISVLLFGGSLTALWVTGAVLFWQERKKLRRRAEMYREKRITGEESICRASER